MDLAPLEEVLGEAPALLLPIRPGQVYRVEECSGAVWLRFQAALERLDQAGATVSLLELQRIARDEHITDVELYQEALGVAWQQMVDDGLTRRELMFCGQVAWLWQLGRHDAAKAFWSSGGKASAPTSTAPTSTSSSTDEASTPPSSTGGSTTTSLTTSRPSSTAARVKGKGRRGPRSSPTAA